MYRLPIAGCYFAYSQEYGKMRYGLCGLIGYRPYNNEVIVQDLRFFQRYGMLPIEIMGCVLW